MDSGQVSNIINMQFKYAGVIAPDADYRAHANLIRKSTSSGLFDAGSESTNEQVLL